MRNGICHSDWGDEELAVETSPYVHQTVDHDVPDGEYEYEYDDDDDDVWTWRFRHYAH